MRAIRNKVNCFDYGARFYDPQLGRFTIQDPLSDEFNSWTPYHYVHNNPINLVDPTGMQADEYDIVLDEDGNETTTWRSNKGGDDVDYYNHYQTMYQYDSDGQPIDGTGQDIYIYTSAEAVKAYRINNQTLSK